MTPRVQRLIGRFELINDEVYAIAEKCSPEEWLSRCPAEGWTVVAVVRDIAGAYPPQVEVIRNYADGEPIPNTHTDWSTIDQSNPRFAVKVSNADRDETLALLRRYATDVCNFLASLLDEQLDYTANFPLMNETRTTQRMIERILLGHPEEHLASIPATVSMHQS